MKGCVLWLFITPTALKFDDEVEVDLWIKLLKSAEALFECVAFKRNDKTVTLLLYLCRQWIYHFHMYEVRRKSESSWNIWPISCLDSWSAVGNYAQEVRGMLRVDVQLETSRKRARAFNMHTISRQTTNTHHSQKSVYDNKRDTQICPI